MLSWSATTTGRTIDLRAVADPTRDPGLPGGRELLALAEAAVTGEHVLEARERLLAALGPAATVDAAAVAGNFEMMNRIADGTGMPVGKAARRDRAFVIEALDLDRLDHTGT